jgi:phosphoribosyl 1,2-cyclic phosphodiesterase
VRGSIPTPEVSHLGYGGNTACLEIRYGDQLRLIIDAGSGLRRLGLALSETPPQSDGDTHLFLSHFHWDHVQGLPFFVPLYHPDWKLTFYSARPVGELEAALATQMRAPHFPAEAAVRASREYRRVEPGGVRLGAITIQAFALNHPDGCVGYRIDAPHASLVYATDHEHGRDPASDHRLREYARGADVLIYDAQFTPQEFEFKKGWGHSTWLEGAGVARDAGVKQLLLFHHDPERGDGEVSEIVDQARAVFENTAGAREGWSAEL